MKNQNDWFSSVEGVGSDAVMYISEETKIPIIVFITYLI